jgi:hypothetical protein
LVFFFFSRGVVLFCVLTCLGGVGGVEVVIKGDEGGDEGPHVVLYYRHHRGAWIEGRSAVSRSCFSLFSAFELGVLGAAWGCFLLRVLCLGVGFIGSPACGGRVNEPGLVVGLPLLLGKSAVLVSKWMGRANQENSTLL